MFAVTLRLSHSARSCHTTASWPWRRAAAGCRPQTVTVPASGTSAPLTHCTRVVFPAPFSPTTATSSPGATVTDTASRTRRGPTKTETSASWIAYRGLLDVTITAPSDPGLPRRTPANRRLLHRADRVVGLAEREFGTGGLGYRSARTGRIQPSWPWRRASSVRLRTPSFRKMFPRWNSTVFTDTKSREAAAARSAAPPRPLSPAAPRT